ncbi:MAG: N4-gp56 family major capsid protein [Clostridia bacterium]|nr:N4-gp56 family major capsid protein [Clostridia bacterium]
MNELFEMNLQLFADAGTLVNTTQNFVNAYTGEAQEFDDNHSLSPTMKTYYEKDLLENTTPKLVFTQLGKKESLPANNGRTKEWRRPNTLPLADILVEGVIPEGKKMGMVALTSTLTQRGMYVTISDVLEKRAIDPQVLIASKELSRSAGMSMDVFTRNELMTGTNVMFCDTVNADGTTTEVVDYDEMSLENNRLTPDMVLQAKTFLEKCDAPEIDGSYVAVIHPSAAYDIMRSPDWVAYHQYASVKHIFEGELGELYGVRFLKSNNAKITKRTLSDGEGAVYSTLFFGEDAFGVIDPEEGGLEMIVKDRGEIGGPLEQFSTAGYKFEHAAKILYPERMICVESCSKYSAKDEEN